MVLAPAMQASRNPVSLPLAPTINSAIRAKVGNNGRMPGRGLPRFDSPSIAAVIGRRRDPQALGSFGNGRVIDRLDVDAVLFEQEVAGLLAQLGIADEQRHD